MIHEEAQISVILPSILPNDFEIADVINKLEITRNLKLYIYYIPYNQDLLSEQPEAITSEVSKSVLDNLLKEGAIILCDRILSKEKLLAYYNQIIDYHQAIGETLSEKDMELRDKEVKEKWLNGNFNYWLFNAEEVF